MKIKKALTRAVSLLVLTAFFVLCFTACTPTPPADGGEENPAMTVIGDDYKIIYGADNARARTVAGYVQRQLTEQHGIELSMRKDTTTDPTKREIIVGSTAREVAAPFGSYMGSGGWCVRAEGERIIVEGATSEALREAAEYLISCLKKNSNGEIVFMHTDTKTERKTDELAAANVTLTVATFNIRNGADVGHDMAKLAELIIPLGIDIIGLQEVDICTGRAGGKNTLKELAEAAGYEYYAFSRAIDYSGGQYGTAVMSKYPITSYETMMLTTPAEYEQRVCGHAVIDVGGTSIDFYNAHLSYEETDVRLAQIAELNAAVSKTRGFIVTGDFNTDDNTQRAAIGGTLTNADKYGTFRSSGADIDDIVLHGGWDILASDMVDVQGKSDHNLLYARIKFVG